MKKYRIFRVQPRIWARVAPSIRKLYTPALSPQNVLTSAQTYLSFSSSTLPMVSCASHHAEPGQKKLPRAGHVSKCDAKHARTAHHQESAHSHAKNLALGLLRGELVVSGPAALRLLTHAAGGRQRLASVQHANTGGERGQAAGDVPRLAARPRACDGGPRAHRRCSWLVGACLSFQGGLEVGRARVTQGSPGGGAAGCEGASTRGNSPRAAARRPA